MTTEEALNEWIAKKAQRGFIKRKTFSKETRDKVYSKTNGHCYYCGKAISEEDMQVDHFEPFFMGDYLEGKSIEEAKQEYERRSNIGNLVPACRLCNRLKSSYSIEGFRGRIKHSVSIVRKRKHAINADNDKIYHIYGLEDAKDEETAKVKFFFEYHGKE